MKGADAVVSGYLHLGREDEIHVQPCRRVKWEVLRTGNQYCGMSGFSLRREIALTERLDETLQNGQDWDIYVRLLQKDRAFWNIPKPIFLYRFMNMSGIGAKVAGMSPDDALIRLRTADKHRQFLGDENYRKRVAAQLLVYLPLKKDKMKWVMKSVYMAGFSTTLNHLARVTIKKLRQRVC